MKFFKENSYDVIRLFINQIGIAIFSLILYTALGMVNLESGNHYTIKAIISAFAILFYFALIYTVAWDWGAKDKIRIDGKRMEPIKLKGAKLAFWANVPNFVFSFIYALTMGLYCLGIEGVKNLSAIFNVIVRFIMSMHLGFLQAIFSFLADNQYVYHFWQAVGYFIVPIFAIAVTELGYSLGMREKKIFGSIRNKKQITK